MKDRCRILVVAAHPDDEILGCGGTMSRYIKNGNDVQVAILGEGITSRFESREGVDKSLLKNLHEQCKKAINLLGIQELHLANLPDNRFDSLPLLEVIRIVEDIMTKYRPDIIYTHHPGDLNIDHSITFKAVMTASRPQSGCSVREIYAFEVPSSTEWSFQKISPTFQPNVFVDIESEISSKIDSMLMYESEIRKFPHPRSMEAIRVIARRWGTVVGFEYAEAFELIRSIRK